MSTHFLIKGCVWDRKVSKSFFGNYDTMNTWFSSFHWYHTCQHWVVIGRTILTCTSLSKSLICWLPQ